MTEIPAMTPSAGERRREIWDAARRASLGRGIDEHELRTAVCNGVELAYRDGHAAALFSLSPLIEAARKVERALYEDTDAADHPCCGWGPLWNELRGALSTFPAPASPSRPVAWLRWAHKTFGDVALDPKERTLRFIEEAIELAHAMGLDEAAVAATADRVYARERGNIAREIGQAQACLEALAEAIEINASDEATREWERVQSIPQEEWDRRHGAKVKLGIALPASPSTSAETKP